MQDEYVVDLVWVNYLFSIQKIKRFDLILKRMCIVLTLSGWLLEMENLIFSNSKFYLATKMTKLK